MQFFADAQPSPPRRVAIRARSLTISASVCLDPRPPRSVFFLHCRCAFCTEPHRCSTPSRHVPFTVSALRQPLSGPIALPDVSRPVASPVASHFCPSMDDALCRRYTSCHNAMLNVGAPTAASVVCASLVCQPSKQSVCQPCHLSAQLRANLLSRLPSRRTLFAALLSPWTSARIPSHTCSYLFQLFNYSCALVRSTCAQ